MARQISAEIANLIDGGQYRTHMRVLVNRGGAWYDLTALDGGIIDLVKSATYSDSVEDQSGRCTIRLAREVQQLSIAPLNTISKLTNMFGSYEPLVREGRVFRLQVQLKPMLVGRNDNDWIDVFKGQIDSVDASSGELVIEGRHHGIALMQDTYIETEAEYGANPPTAAVDLENVIGSIIKDNGPDGPYNPTADWPNLYFPTESGVGVSPKFKQEQMSIMDAVQRLADLAGWSVRQRYLDPPAIADPPPGYEVLYGPTPPEPGWYLYFYDPRAAESPEWSFGPDNFTKLVTSRTDSADVRNAIEVVYSPHLDIDRSTGRLKLINNFQNGDTVTIGTRTYTFKSGALYTGQDQINIGIDDSTGVLIVDPNVTERAKQISLMNLKKALNNELGLNNGSYSNGTTANADVTAVHISAYGQELLVRSKQSGQLGNSTATTTSSGGRAVWGGATLAGGVNTEAKTAAIENTASIEKYGRRYARFADGAKMLHTNADAVVLAHNILDDLSEPALEHAVELPFHPYIEAGDLVYFTTDGVANTETQQLGVHSIEHNLMSEGCTTTITCKGRPTVGKGRWLRKETRIRPAQVTTPPPKPVYVRREPKPGGGEIIIDVGGGATIGGGTPGTFHPPAGVPPGWSTPVRIDLRRTNSSGDVLPGDAGKAVSHPVGDKQGPVGLKVYGIPGQEMFWKATPVSANGVEGEALDVSMTPERALSGFLDVSSNPGFIPPNGNFEHQADEEQPFDHWSIQPIFNNDTIESKFEENHALWQDFDGDVGNSFVMAANFRSAFQSSLFEIRRGTRNLCLYVSLRKDAHSSATNERLNVRLEFYAYVDGPVVHEYDFTFSAAAAGPLTLLDSWTDLASSYEIGSGDEVPEEANFVRVVVFRGTDSANDYGSSVEWRVGDIFLKDEGFYHILGNHAKFDGVLEAGSVVAGAAEIAQDNFAAVTFSNNFSDVGGSYATAKYLKDSLGFIHLRGVVNRASAALNTAIFTLPSGYRPTADETFCCVADGKMCRVDVDTSGNVFVVSADSATWHNSISLCGISFATW